MIADDILIISVIRKLEYIKYCTTILKSRITHTSDSEMIEYNDIDIKTPEEKIFTIKRLRINLFKPQEGENFIKINWGKNVNNTQVLSPSIEPLDFLNSTNDKLYVFFSEQFYALEETNQQEHLSYLKSNISKGSFWATPYCILIQVDGNSINSFESFMNITSNEWQEKFNNAITEAKKGITSSLNLYDPRILNEAINIDDKIELLENFDLLNLTPELIINILNANNKPDAIKIYNKLQYSEGLNFKLWQFFVQYIVGSNYFAEYNEALIKLSMNIINQNIVESIGLLEKDIYLNYVGKWELFYKLATDASTFVISSNYLDVKFGIMNYGAEESTVIAPPFKSDGNLHFSYRAFSVKPPDNKYIRVGTGLNPIPPYVNIENISAFKIVKVYIVDNPYDVDKIDNYSKFIKHFFARPENYANQDSKSTSKFLRFTYIPALCAYNLYLMNNANLTFQVMQQIVGASLIGISGSTGGASVVLGTLATTDTVVAIVNLTVNFPGIREEILSKYGNDGQKFLDACDTLSTVTMGLNLAYGGFYGAKNIIEFVTNRNIILESSHTFYKQYFKLNNNLSRILQPFFEVVYKNIAKSIDELDDYLGRLNPMLQEGRSYEWIIAYKKTYGVFPHPNQYIKPEVLAKYMAELQTQEVAFFISKREIVEVKYTQLQQSKFVGFTGDMDRVRLNFEHSGNDIKQLINDLKVAPDKFNLQDEIYLVYVKSDKGFNYTMPTGNEPGVFAEFFKPAGILPTIDDITNFGVVIRPREVIITNANLVIHNNNWDTFASFFGTGNIRKIYP